MKLMHIVGARPNFMKIAPILRCFEEDHPSVEQVLVHTGQHYDHAMSTAFFEDLEIRSPDEFLGVGGGSHSQQTAAIMTAFEPILRKHRPDWLVVVGDVNSTMACSLVAAKERVRIAHVEAGLRSRDRTMPEEINRIVTDSLSDLLLTPSPDADLNLLSEGVPKERIRLVGNVMIDTLKRMLPKVAQSAKLSDLNLSQGKYVLLTMHRPSNVDDPESLERLIVSICQAAEEFPVVFPVHPRTRKNWESLKSSTVLHNLVMIDPAGYLDFIQLMKNSRLVVTDSGGVQEETTYLGVPCITLRPNTERPITISEGTNELVPPSPEEASLAVKRRLGSSEVTTRCPAIWDGAAATRIAQAILDLQQ